MEVIVRKMMKCFNVVFKFENDVVYRRSTQSGRDGVESFVEMGSFKSSSSGGGSF